ncbi:MAG TPA: sugar O-acetyltransferase [Candidatus Limnocylindria bacterium]|nr:sugar O-acetyltransferase [Candidatus Limnocylindria bacterium]
MSEHRDRMLRGDPYRADDSELVKARRRCAQLLQRLIAVGNADEEARDELLLQLFGSLGEGSTVIVPLHCDYGTNVSIGARTFVNANVVLLDPARITVGDDVQIGPNVQLLTATHPLEAAERASGWESAKPISIGDGAWLGGGVIVGPGVTVGARTVVGAGTVVVRDLPGGVLAVGNPARVVRSL